MFVAAIAQFAVNILVLIWILKKKPGERFSKKTVVKSLLCGMLVLVVGFLLPLKKDTFFGMNPLLFSSVWRSSETVKFSDGEMQTLSV